VKIYIIDAFHEAGVELARQHADVVCWPDPAIKDWPEHADAVMVRSSPITADELGRARHVKIISKQGIGVDGIALGAARQHGIPVCRTPGINSHAVAEMAFALSLAVTRRVVRFDRAMRAGEDIVRPKNLGIEMQGKTVGVVGMGNIGTIVARKWRGAFDARIVAYDPHAPSDAWSDIEHRRVDRLDELLTQVDLLTIHTPLTDETRHLIGREQIARMKAGSVVINVSRGGIVEEGALFDALKSGHLFGAACDVFEIEPPPADHPLLSLPNFIATPHAAAGTVETQIRSATTVAQQALDVLAGKPVPNRVV
jgi:D-3-phosphoglycerate dehydrogenase